MPRVAPESISLKNSSDSLRSTSLQQTPVQSPPSDKNSGNARQITIQPRTTDINNAGQATLHPSTTSINNAIPQSPTTGINNGVQATVQPTANNIKNSGQATAQPPGRNNINNGEQVTIQSPTINTNNTGQTTVQPTTTNTENPVRPNPTNSTGQTRTEPVVTNTANAGRTTIQQPINANAAGQVGSFQPYDPPPSYTNDPPPSYDSLYGRMKRVHRLSVVTMGSMDLHNVANRDMHAICDILALIFSLLLPFLCIVIGALNLNNCPVQRYIPIYLIVAGFFGIVKGMTYFVLKIKEGEDSRKPAQNDCLISCFLFPWLVAGSYWVYSAYGKIQQTNDPMNSNYCDKTAYWFSFWVITLDYVLSALWLCCCIVFCVIQISQEEFDEDEESLGH